MRVAALLLAAGLSIPALGGEPVLITHVPDAAPEVDPEDPAPVLWNVLACAKSRCALEPASAYFKGKRRNKDKIGLAMMTELPERKSVPEFFNSVRARTKADEAYGSLAVVLDVPGQRGWRIVPRLSRTSKDSAVTVYLEQGSRRQSVAAFPRDWLDALIAADEIVYWAGDLDGDGKPDLLMLQPPADFDNERDRKTGLHLWLSSLAAAGQLVGYAASAPDLPDAEEEQ